MKMKHLMASSLMLASVFTLSAQKTVPEGSDLAEFITANVPEGSTEEVSFHLVAGATYHLSDSADFCLAAASVVGDAENRPLVVVSGSGAFITQNGLKVLDVDFDMTDAPHTGFVKLSSKPDSIFSTKGLGLLESTGTVREGFVMMNPIVIKGCNFRNIPNSILTNNYAAWAVKELTIDNCVMQFNKQSADAVIDFTTPGAGNDWTHFGQVKDLTLTNSTFYNLTEAKARFVRYMNRSNSTPAKAFGVGARSVHTIDGCTFYNVFSHKEFANNTPKTDKRKVVIDNTIFYNTSRLDKFFEGCPVESGKNNMAWLAGVDDDGVEQPMRDGVKQIAYIENPDFVGPCDNAFDLGVKFGGVSFRAQNATAVENKIGDPRWFDTSSAIDCVEVTAPSALSTAEYYNLQGLRVTPSALTPGLYIKRQGDKTVKVLVK